MRNATCLLACFVSPLFPTLLAAADEPTLESLIDLNGEAIFGTKARLEAGDRITLLFGKGSQFDKSFAGRGMMKPEALVGELNRLILVNPAGEGEIPEVAIAGRGAGDWSSKFDLSGDLEVRFTMRVQAIQKGSNFVLFLNQAPKAKTVLEIGPFFSRAVLSAGGKKKQAAAPKDYQAPDRWFDKNCLVTIAAAFKGGNFTLRMQKATKDPKDAKDVELLKLDDAQAAPGKVRFVFQNLNFVLSNVTLTGKVDREWVKSQIDALRAKKTLVEKEAPKPPEPAPLRKKKEEKADDGKDTDEEL